MGLLISELVLAEYHHLKKAITGALVPVAAGQEVTLKQRRCLRALTLTYSIRKSLHIKYRMWLF